MLAQFLKPFSELVEAGSGTSSGMHVKWEGGGSIGSN
jgi:hypothetical protein